MIPIRTLNGDNAGGVVFSNIPQDFTHLQLRCLTRGVRSFTGEQFYLRANNFVTNEYAYNYMYGTGGGSTANFGLGDTNVIFLGEFPAANEISNLFQANIIDILDYSNTNKFKSVKSISGQDNNNISAGNNSNAWVGYGLIKSTNAITSLSVISNGAFTSDSKFTLYGLGSSPLTGA